MNGNEGLVRENAKHHITGLSTNLFEHRPRLPKLPSKCPTKKTQSHYGSRELLLERDARKPASAKHIGGEPTRDRITTKPFSHSAPRGWEETHDPKQCQEAKKRTPLQTTETEGTQHPRITTTRRRVTATRVTKRSTVVRDPRRHPMPQWKSTTITCHEGPQRDILKPSSPM